MTPALATVQDERRNISLDNRLTVISVAAVWLVLFLPLYTDLSASAWQRDENSLAPFILAFCAGAILLRLRYLERSEFNATNFLPTRRDTAVGYVLILFGLLLVLLGRVEEIEFFSTAAQPLTAIGVCLLLGGAKLTRILAVPLAMLFYAVVWPGWLIDQLTAPLKLWISDSVAAFLSLFGLPIAHSGVTLAVGQYQLLIADACAGLNSLISLTSIGAMYLYIVRRKGTLNNLIVFVSIIPIAIFANFLRVTLLALITYYLGYDVGQGFLHDFAGFFMFAVALLSVFVVDEVVTSISARLRRAKQVT